jgi:hypothetical protein
MLIDLLTERHYQVLAKKSSCKVKSNSIKIEFKVENTCHCSTNIYSTFFHIVALNPTRSVDEDLPLGRKMRFSTHRELNQQSWVEFQFIRYNLLTNLLNFSCQNYALSALEPQQLKLRVESDQTKLGPFRSHHQLASSNLVWSDLTYYRSYSTQ